MEKVWLSQYDEGVPEFANVTACSSITAVFNESAAKYSARPGFTNMGKTLTYGQTKQLVDQFASYLQNVLKLPRGERVAIMMPNVLQYPIAVFAILQAGYVVVNVNPLYTPRELEHQLKDSGATTIIVLENFANTLASVLKQTPVKNVILANIGEMLGGLKGMITNFVIRKVKKMVPAFHIPNAITFSNALEQGKAHSFQVVELSLNDTAFLQYTGGTTGVSKGAVLSHGNIVANMMQAGAWIKAKISHEGETILTALPLYHIFCLTVNLMIFTKIGAHNILITNPRDIPNLVKEIDTYKVSVITAVNTLFNALVHNPEFAKVDFSRLKIALGGGMAVQQAVADKWKAITKQPIIEAYGLTETSPGVCVNPLSSTNYSGNIGLPISDTEIEVRDGDGKALGFGETGELFVRGPQVMQGYWNKPEETEKVLGSDGFLATGDIVIVNEQGFVKIVDRKKDMIVISGFNVYPNEIEDVVAMHPGVLEVACVGVPSEKSGEAIRLFVVKKDPNLTAEALIEHCRANLTGYKVPKDIVFKTELPKTNVGKILRRELKDLPVDA
ncbi:AMP-dependent synthetase/ligase [Vitreoscilla sp. C1]|uniref:AMP-binding protein n=1 Tax=Vitreoscilla sp. (strain C1) TaxID=96942 RepID=UPI000CDCCBBD|nr:AMP-binding protein [Vitreoscilla sp. C1]AUZ04198.1 AMP-dependent synthetase/ligase [Vitreoscilla sp. C1]